MVCPRCGGVVQPGVEYCPSCGVMVAQGAAPPPAQPQYPQPWPQQPWPPQPYPPQPYPYQYPQPQPYAPPGDGTSSLGKVIIIIVVLLLVFVVIGAVIFYLFVASVEDLVDGTGSATVSLQAPIASARQVNDATYCDISFTVNRIAPATAVVSWSEVLVDVESASGSTLLAATPPFVDMPLAYDDGTDGTVDVQVWFMDADDDGEISSGDYVKLTGLTAAYEGGQLELRLGLTLISASTMPSDFPS